MPAAETANLGTTSGSAGMGGPFFPCPFAAHAPLVSVTAPRMVTPPSNLTGPFTESDVQLKSEGTWGARASSWSTSLPGKKDGSGGQDERKGSAARIARQHDRTARLDSRARQRAAAGAAHK